MEDTLRVIWTVTSLIDARGLNPCFNGRYSQRKFIFGTIFGAAVLILVLMEDTLRGGRTWFDRQD